MMVHQPIVATRNPIRELKAAHRKIGRKYRAGLRELDFDIHLVTTDDAIVHLARSATLQREGIDLIQSAPSQDASAATFTNWGKNRLEDSSVLANRRMLALGSRRVEKVREVARVLSYPPRTIFRLVEEKAKEDPK